MSRKSLSKAFCHTNYQGLLIVGGGLQTSGVCSRVVGRTATDCCPSPDHRHSHCPQLMTARLLPPSRHSSSAVHRHCQPAHVAPFGPVTTRHRWSAAHSRRSSPPACHHLPSHHCPHVATSHHITARLSTPSVRPVPLPPAWHRLPLLEQGLYRTLAARALNAPAASIPVYTFFLSLVIVGAINSLDYFFNMFCPNLLNGRIDEDRARRKQSL